MYQDNGAGFHGGVGLNDFSMEEPPYNHQNAAVAAASALELELQQQLVIEECYGEQQYHHQHQHQNDQIFASTASMAEAAAPYPAGPDFLNIFPLPRCSPSPLLPNFSHQSPAFLASLGLLGDHVNSSGEGVVYDPLLPLNLPPQPPLLRELFNSMPHSGGVYSTNGGGLFTNGVDEREAMYQNGDLNYEFTAVEIGKSRDGGIKDSKHFATEKHRRIQLNGKYNALKMLIPSPTKNDRASVVGDAIKYINELKMTVTELQGLVEKKRCARERLKRPKIEAQDDEGKYCVGDMDPFNGSSSLRSSWLHRKSKNSEVDVRIVDDEVTVKLVQQRRVNCLLFVSKALDEMQLDLHHVAGGVIGDYYSYLFNSKICEGSMVYASAVANKLIEVVDKQYAAATVPLPSTSSF